MNTSSLVVTTAFAVTVAAAALAMLLFVFLRERRRAEARVIALRRLAGDAEPAAPPSVGPTEFDDYAATSDTGARPMFSETPERSPWPARLAVAATTIGLIGAAGYALLPRSHQPEPATQQTAEIKPLELLSLRHSQEEGRLVITGLVHNPRAGAPLTRVVATAFLFGSDGTFLTSARSPLDFSTLTPGDESPFVLSVPVNGTVARYRVGFRAEDGRVIAHVDRRTAGTLARTGE
jgi:hypothetical protein